jgi:hypothetical protein
MFARRPRRSPGRCTLPPCPVPSRSRKERKQESLAGFNSKVKKKPSQSERYGWMDHAFVHLLSFPVRRASQSIRSDDQTFPIDQSVRVRETRVPRGLRLPMARLTHGNMKKKKSQTQSCLGSKSSRESFLGSKSSREKHRKFYMY